MKTRYVKTKSEGAILQYQNIFGSWRDIRYLNSDLRKVEKDMNKLLDKLSKLAEKREDYLIAAEDADKDIKSGGTGLFNTGNVKVVNIGFSKWLSSFTCQPLFAEQKDTWKPVIALLRKNSFIKMSASKTTLVMTNLASRTLVANPNKKDNNGGGKGKGKNKQNNNQ
ncbi:MAG: hypothetical protein HRT61_10465 [Ekhidna sp.]|nr:hypothetical protein [Ekhidna sp.]